MWTHRSQPLNRNYRKIIDIKARTQCSGYNISSEHARKKASLMSISKILMQLPNYFMTQPTYDTKY